MSTALMVHVPVQDLARATRFFAALGFAFDQRFADETTQPIILGDNNYVVLVAASRFKNITAKEVANSATSAEAILQLRVESRQRVDDLVDRALAAGGQVANPTNDQGFLYGRSFSDLDGHNWDVFFLDPAAPQRT